MVNLTMQWVAAATAGYLASGAPEAVIGRVVTDSRTLAATDFFIALRGARFDGHTFVADAVSRGASGVVVDAEWAAHGLPPLLDSIAGRPTGVIVVGDTLGALQDMAQALRAAVGTRVVAITGSAGKTTTKETIATFLAAKYRVVRNKGNLNNHIGLPLSLMDLREEPDVAVMELGMNHAGEIRTLVGIADPDVRVWTNVGDAHLGHFASAEGIADAKAEILEAAEPGDLLVCNADDTRVMARVGAFPGRTITFGYSQFATVRAVDVESRGIAGMRARVVTPAGERVIETGLLGRGNLLNVLAATAVALEFDVPLARIAELAAELRPASRRGSVHRLGRGVTLIDDSYNSSPAALRRTLDVLRQEPGPFRKVAVLGEMLELGDHATGLHELCGVEAAGSGLAVLVTVGGAPARELASAAIRAGMPADAVHHFDRSEAAVERIEHLVRDGDLVLVKGSRGSRTDLVADRLAEVFG